MQARGEETVEEDVGEDYLEELIHRSMIQVVKREWDGRVKSCHFKSQRFKVFRGTWKHLCIPF